MKQDVKSRIEQVRALMREGSLTSAYFALRRVFRKDPDNIDALVLSAELSLRQGKRTDSEDTVSRLFELDPVHFDSAMQKRLGHICFSNELYSMAAQMFEWASEKHDDLSLYQSGICLRRLGRMESAEQRLLECLKSKPDVAAPYLQLGHVHKANGNTDRAEHYYKRYIALSSTGKGTGYWCVADLNSYTFTSDEIEKIKRELDLRQEDLPQLSALNFALGRAAEKEKDYASAMEYYDKGNLIQVRLNPFHAEQYRNIVSGLQAVVAADENPTQRNEYPVAILIVGLPRSGTTLVEQILSAHSQVQATDELPFLERFALRLEMNGGYPARLSSMTQEEKGFLRKQYVNGASDYLQQESNYFIDKYPGNFLHIGLVKRIMPESIIIDVRRDPRDIAISAYRQLFPARNEFASSFDGIDEYYRGYRAMVDHWQSVYPNQLKTVNYEQLVNFPDEEILALLDFCGLESERGCFEFHKNERAIMTPSVNQVSKPMYTSSIGQWRRYDEFAQDEMARFGCLLESDQTIP